MSAANENGLPPADLMRRLLSLAYEALLLCAVLALGAGFAWALVDQDHQFLHDRLAGTRIVKDEG
jgi:hypothetical protein